MVLGSLSDSLIAGLLGLVGVGVGAALTEWRESRRREEAQWAAMAFVTDDLMLGLRELVAAREEGKWWPGEHPIPLSSSEGLKTLVTNKETLDRWAAPRAALALIGALNRSARTAGVREMTELDLMRTDAAIEYTLIAIESLAPGSLRKIETEHSPVLQERVSSVLEKLSRDNP